VVRECGTNGWDELEHSPLHSTPLHSPLSAITTMATIPVTNSLLANLHHSNLFKSVSHLNTVTK